MRGYKGFEQGMICRGKQYEEDTVFREARAEPCKSGMHFCKNPFDVLDYYSIINENGEFNEFAEVEALDEPVTDDGRKFASTELKIGAKLSFRGFIDACVNFALKKTKFDNAQTDSGDSAKIGSSGDSAKIGSSGYYAQIGSSGYSAKIGSSGDSAKIGSSGYSAKIGSSGDSAKIGSSGDYAQIGSSGDYAQIGSSGDSAKIGSSGDSAKIGSSGYSAKIGSSGDYAQIGSSGYYAQIGSSGDSAKIGSSGDYAQIGSSGKNSVIMCAGDSSKVKAKKGSWITLAEWQYIDNEWTPVCVKTEQVDGERIKEDTFYILKGGKFVECE